MISTMFHEDLVTSDRILYTSSAFAKSSLLFLQEIGKLEANRPHTSQRKNLESYLLMYVQKGSGILKYKGITYTLHPGDCVFIDCRVGYAHSTYDNLWALKWLHFSGPFMETIYEKYMERGGKVKFHPGNMDALDALWEKLYKTAESSDYIRDMRINEGLTSLMTLLMEQSWHPESKKITPAIKKDLNGVQCYLDKHFKEKLSLEQIASEFFMNKYYLAHMFKESFGMTVVEYLQYKRVNLGKQLLRFSELTVEEVARECGIEDANYFSRAFRKIEGIPPAKYRKLWQN